MCKIHGNRSASGSEGGLHVDCPVLCSGTFILPIECGEVVVAGLHRPDFVSLRGEGFSSITLHADVRKHRLPILIERQASCAVWKSFAANSISEGCAVCFPKR